jgi:transcriptional regulator with XRE-family HTH domain
MALDSGNPSEAYRSAAWAAHEPVSLLDAPTLGEALREAREASGRTLAHMSEVTRVRRDYLLALEQNAWDRLPSRPFALGYLRAYAEALGLDEETAADRFKAEHRTEAPVLQAPVGSELDEVARPERGKWVAGVSVLVGAVVVWNVVQHVVNRNDLPPPTIARTPAGWTVGAPVGEGVVMEISAPRPAPADQTVPAPYITPGLEQPLTEALGAAAVQTPADTGPVRRAFNPKGAVYGAQPDQSRVILQARKSANLVVKNGQNIVYFARQLAAGEAYRAPMTAGLIADVSDPAAFDVFLNGEHQGVLPAQTASLEALNRRAADAARTLAALAEAQAAAQARAAQVQAAQVQAAPAVNVAPAPVSAGEPTAPSAG